MNNNNTLFPALFFAALIGLASKPGQSAPACVEPQASQFKRVVLVNTGMGDPMELAVAYDGRVFWFERSGKLMVRLPESTIPLEVGELPVEFTRDDGGLGLALDPEFKYNDWVYLFYSPKGSENVNRLSRFNLVQNKLVMASEKIVLDVPVQRISVCHTAGSIAFGPGRNLYLSTGDNTDPFESQGFAPIDERAGRERFDAQGSSGNTNDLRGKILRIHPEANGTYTIPAGNLFAPGLAKTRPEIYIMGCRNPFRIHIDAPTNQLFWGEVGPDAVNTIANQGPAGEDEFNMTKTAGNFGWPLFVGDNKAYNHFDFTTSTPRETFVPDAPRNLSPSNTGLTDLPPARKALIWYTYGGSTVYPTLPFHGGRTAIGGPLYRYDPDLVSNRKFPPYFEGRQFLMDWSQLWLRTLKWGSQGEVTDLKNFAADLRRPIDSEFGPDGSLYILEFGMENPYGGQGALVRWEYTGTYDDACYQAPVVSVSHPDRGLKYRSPRTNGVPLSWKGRDFTMAGARLPTKP